MPRDPIFPISVSYIRGRLEKLEKTAGSFSAISGSRLVHTSSGTGSVMAECAERPGSTATVPRETVSDESLLQQYRGGDQNAATQLYKRYVTRLRAVAESKCSNKLARRVDADDIVQSVFRTFFRGLNQGLYDVPESQQLWNLLLVIVANKARARGAYHNAAKRDVRLTAAVDYTEESVQAKLEDPTPPVELQMAIQDALEQLDSRQRQMVEMRIQGHEVTEIANLTKRSKRTVERTLQDARNKLRELLEQAE
jgi:RNA polymerase sigma-70 factor (ECF subfamily)